MKEGLGIRRGFLGWSGDPVHYLCCYIDMWARRGNNWRDEVAKILPCGAEFNRNLIIWDIVVPGTSFVAVPLDKVFV